MNSYFSEKLVESPIDLTESSPGYFPNMCNVCHRFGNKVIDLKRCSACDMISYCGIQHQRQDWSSHQSFCKAMRQIKSECKLNNIFDELKDSYASFAKLNPYSSSIEDFEIQTNFLTRFVEKMILKAAHVLKRKLHTLECEMIFNPKICAVCLESNPKLLTKCNRCPQHNFCNRHLEDSDKYQDDCLKFLIIAGLQSQHEALADVISLVKIAKLPPTEKVLNLPTSTMDFLQNCMPETMKIAEAFSDERKSSFITFLSERYSKPLSLSFALKKLNLTKSLMLVHVIGAGDDEHFCTDWEIMFHFLSELRQLKLILIGPDLVMESHFTKPVCVHCKHAGKEIRIESKKMLYEEYCAGKSFQTPDIIVAYNPGFHTYSSWKKCLLMLGKLKRPLMITSLDRAEGLMDKSIVDTEYNSAKCIFSDKNPFESLLYLRRLMNITSTKNNVMTLYQDLGTGETQH